MPRIREPLDHYPRWESDPGGRPGNPSKAPATGRGSGGEKYPGATGVIWEPGRVQPEACRLL